VRQKEKREEKTDFLNAQQKTDSLNAQQQQIAGKSRNTLQLRRSKRIENNSLREKSDALNAQQQQIAGSKSQDTLQLRRSKRIEQAGSLQARSNLVERASASDAEYIFKTNILQKDEPNVPQRCKVCIGPDRTTKVQVVHWGQFGNNLAHRSWAEH
jgi:hypothetical protein